jgi:hypothetical protein
MQLGKQMKVSEILIEGLNNLKGGAAWGKGHFAMNEVGGFVSESSRSPAKFCAWGACRHVGHTKLHTDETTWARVHAAEDLLNKVCKATHGCSLGEFNDREQTVFISISFLYREAIHVAQTIEKFAA